MHIFILHFSQMQIKQGKKISCLQLMIYFSVSQLVLVVLIAKIVVEYYLVYAVIKKNFLMQPNNIY